MSAVIDSLQTRAAQLGIFKGTAGCLKLGAISPRIALQVSAKRFSMENPKKLGFAPGTSPCLFFNPYYICVSQSVIIRLDLVIGKAVLKPKHSLKLFHRNSCPEKQLFLLSKHERTFLIFFIRKYFLNSFTKLFQRQPILEWLLLCRVLPSNCILIFSLSYYQRKSET